VLLLFTDGVTEAVNGAGALFGETRMLDNFAASASRAGAEIVANLMAAVNAYASGVPQEDDITVLALRYR
jgi:serine phosphatase RsbU (regulator of sigma subunit)